MPPKSTAEEKRTCFVSEKIRDSYREVVNKEVCQDLPVDNENEGQYYCLLHYPDNQKHKNTEFNEIFQNRLKSQENHFEYIYFSDRVNVSQHEFNSEANFSGCKFIQDADFIDVSFNERAIFRDAVFMQDIWFAHATFVKTIYFSNSVFESDSEFMLVNTYNEEKMYFTSAVFKSEVIFDDFNTLNNTKVKLHLDDVRFEKPERVSFKNSRLYPNWFVNVNSRKFMFHNIDWENADENKLSTKAEIRVLEDCHIYPKRYRLLTIACRQLADNYEENNHFEQASNFRRMAYESKRLEEFRGFKIWSLHWWYWLSSFYGESWARAAFILFLLVLLVFPFIFTTRVFQVCPTDQPVTISMAENKCVHRNLDILDGSAILQSLATATFQTTEYRKPITGWGEFWIIIEKIFVPIQAALLLLAIRRKFMR